MTMFKGSFITDSSKVHAIVTAQSKGGEAKSLDKTRAIHLRSIEVEFKQKRKKYPISIQVTVDDSDVVQSKRYGENEIIIWEVHKQLPPASDFTVSFKEHHRVLSDVLITTIPIHTGDLFMRPILLIDEPDGEAISIKILCDAPGPFIEIIRLLVDESQKGLSNMKRFLERLRKVCESLNVIVGIAEPVSDIHAVAEMAVAGVKALYEACKEKKECYDRATELMEDIAAFLPFADIQEGQIKSLVTAQTAQQMLLLFEKVSRKIIECSSDSILGFLLCDQIEDVNFYKEGFKKLRETFDWCVMTETWKTVLNIEEYAEAAVLRQLCPVMKSIYNKEKTCFEGSRRDTLHLIKEWSESESGRRLFWLYGTAGSGKSTIANTVARHFVSQNRLAGCFFFDKNDAARRNPENIMPTIAYQLSKWHKAYRSFMLELLQSPDELELYAGLDRQFQLLVERPMARLAVQLPPRHLPLIIVLDGLDECEESRSSRLSLGHLIMKIATAVPWLKVFVSSRMSADLEPLQGEDVQRLDLDDPCVDLQHDIDTWNRIRPDNVRGQGSKSGQIERDIKNFLCRISEALEELNKANPEGSGGKHRTEWKNAFEKLLLQSTRAIVDKPGFDMNERELIKSILVEVSCLIQHEPLSERGLSRFLSALHPDVPEEWLRNLPSSLYPFLVEIGTGELKSSFPVATYLGFLSDKERSGRYWTDVQIIHSRLAHICLDVMNLQLRFNICGLESSHLENERVLDMKSRVRVNISEELKYSSLRYMNHVIHTNDGQNTRKRLMRLFCSPKAMYWIELLSLTGTIEIGKNILLRCAEHFKGDYDIARPAEELYKFISDFSDAIEISTPHIYVSALSWLPPDSFVALHCLSHSSPLFANSRTMANSGHSKLTRCYASWNTSLAECLQDSWCIEYSPNGTKFVSGHTDGRLRIWDAHSGESIGDPPRGHRNCIWAVAFSPNCSRIVSGSADKTLQIWDAQNGVLLVGPFKGHTNSVWSIAYSPDGAKVASGSRDKTVRIWGAQSGFLLGKPLEGHEDVVWSVSFSPDGSRVVSGSNDGTIRVWDVQNSAPLSAPLRGHDNWVTSVTYSPDGSRIVSGSWDRNLRIWSAWNGIPIGEPLKGHELSIRRVDYSSDGSRIISGSLDGLRIWNARTGVLLDILHRDESRWDSDKARFVSIPSWWPEEEPLSMRALAHLDAPIEISDNGWLRTLDRGLFLWVPPDYRNSLCYDVINEVEPPLKINWKGLQHGRSWTNII